MLYKDLVKLNYNLDKLTNEIRKKLRKSLKVDFLDVFTTSDCFIYDFTNKTTIEYYVEENTKYFIAYNPFTKHKLLINPKFLEQTPNNIINIIDLYHLISNLLTGNLINNYDSQDNLYINVNIIKGDLLQFLSKFSQTYHSFKDETYFENVYSLYKTLEKNLPKDKIYFYFTTDTDYELLTENSKLLPFSSIIIATNYNLFEEIFDIREHVWNKISNVNFTHLRPLSAIYNITRYDDDQDVTLEYNIKIILDNEIIIDLISISAIDDCVIDYI